MTVDDFKFVLRNDAKKLARVEELIRMSEDIKAARKIVNMPEFETVADSKTAREAAAAAATAATPATTSHAAASNGGKHPAGETAQ